MINIIAKIPDDLQIREMAIQDYSELMELWTNIEGIVLDESDSYENTLTFLNRNPKLSYVVVVNEKIVATIKCAQDGRRGYISHMAVLPELRHLSLAKILYVRATEELKRQGIWRCNLYVLDANPKAIEFWKYNGVGHPGI